MKILFFSRMRLFNYLFLFFFWSLFLSLFLSLGGCGFHLRGIQKFSPGFKSLYIQTKSPNSTMVLSLHQKLIDNGLVLVSSPEDASMILELSDVSQTQQSISLMGGGQATINRLTDSVSYTLRDAHSHKVLKGPEILSFSQNYSTNASLILSNNYQSNDISRGLDQQLAQAIFDAMRLYQPSQPMQSLS
jgi:LPS-assembly lipoprotein